MKDREDALPEEKLLEIIRGASKNSASSASGILRAIGERFNLRFNPYRSMLYLRRLAAFLFFCSLVFLLQTIFAPKLPFLWGSAKARQQEEKAWPVNQRVYALAPLGEYMQQIKTKGLFNSPQEAQDANAGIYALENISLLGIVLAEPRQAIIKDKKNGGLFYLKEGESLGALKITQIEEGKITVEIEDERYEVHL